MTIFNSFQCSDETLWKDLTNGVKVYIPTLNENSMNVKAVRWSNEMRADASFEHAARLPTPSIFATDIFEMVEDTNNVPRASIESTSYACFMTHIHKRAPLTGRKELESLSTKKKNAHLFIRVKAMQDSGLNIKYHFGAEIMADKLWTRLPVRYKVLDITLYI